MFGPAAARSWGRTAGQAVMAAGGPTGGYDAQPRAGLPLHITPRATSLSAPPLPAQTYISEDGRAAVPHPGAGTLVVQPAAVPTPAAAHEALGTQAAVTG